MKQGTGRMRHAVACLLLLAPASMSFGQCNFTLARLKYGGGMEDESVYHDGEERHRTALNRGVNIVSWFFNQ